MIDLICFVLCCYGMTEVICFGSIFDKVRKVLSWKFLKCPLCVGFHVGYINFFLFYLAGIELFPSFFIGWFIFACISSGVSYILSVSFKD